MYYLISMLNEKYEKEKKIEKVKDTHSVLKNVLKEKKKKNKLKRVVCAGSYLNLSLGGRKRM